jgi:hypothetical protein
MKRAINLPKHWKFAFLAPICAIALVGLAALFDSDAPLDMCLLLMAVAGLVLLVFVLGSLSTGNFRLTVALAFALVSIGVIIFLVILEYGWLRSEFRWLARSHAYKSQVLGQTSPRSGELRHIEWRGWGFAGQDTTVYLVYNPTDSLSGVSQSGRPGKYPGLPCEVYRVSRLESQWYTVQFYTNTFWDRCT